MTSQEIEALYDAHAPRLYALALRVAGEAEAAAAALEEAFLRLWESADLSGEEPLRMLVRLTRQGALDRRQGRTAPAPVVSENVTPAVLVDEAFFGGLTLGELARRYRLEESQVRRMICDGMAALRMQVAQPQ